MQHTSFLCVDLESARPAYILAVLFGTLPRSWSEKGVLTTKEWNFVHRIDHTHFLNDATAKQRLNDICARSGPFSPTMKSYILLLYLLTNIVVPEHVISLLNTEISMQIIISPKHV